jgi:hypothetical protein
MYYKFKNITISKRKNKIKYLLNNSSFCHFLHLLCIVSKLTKIQHSLHQVGLLSLKFDIFVSSIRLKIFTLFLPMVSRSTLWEVLINIKY